MTVEKNKEVVHLFIDNVINANAPKRAGEYADPHWVLDFPGYPEPVSAHNFEQFTSMTREGFPDFHVKIEELIGEGDNVVAIVTQSGTHQGSFRGMPATGKSYKIRAHVLYRLRDGKITEIRPIFDRLDMMEQLGLAQRAMAKEPVGAGR